LLKVENFQLQIFCRPILQNFLFEENFPVVEMGFKTGLANEKLETGNNCLLAQNWTVR
jgi:hypothetical protein